MSREFDLIQQSVKAKKDGVAQETRSRGVIFQTEEDLFEQKAMQNKSIFENAGIVRLFQELIDNGTVKYSDKPVMSEGEYVRTGRFFHRLKWVEPKVILPYTPAKIEWHKTTDYIEKYDNTSVSLVFNGDRHYSSPSARAKYGSYDAVIFFLTSDQKVGVFSDNKLVEIKQEEIPMYISNKISKTIE